MAKNQAKIKFTADTAEFNSQIKTANSTLASLRAGLKLNEAELKNTGDKAEYLKTKHSILEKELETNEAKQEALTGKIEAAKAAYGENSSQVQQLSTQLIKAKTEEENLKSAISNCESEMNEMASETEQAKTPLETLTSTIEEQQSELDKLKTEYKNVALEQGTDSGAAQELKSQIDSLNGELKENQDKLENVSDAVEDAGEKAESSANGGWTVLKGVVSDLASSAIQKAVGAVEDFAGGVVETGMGFDTAMSQVAATMGTTVGDIENMESAAKEMGSTTEWTSTQAAEALNYLALAGYSSEQAVSTLPTVLNLASAGGMDLADASDMVTDAMTSLGIEADSEGKNITTFGDQMARTASKSNTSVSQLGEAILTVGGTAKSLSGGTTELNTALGILADNSIKGSEGGTHLRNILLALNPTTDTAQKAWKKLGVSAYDADGNLRPLQDTFADLNTAMAGMTDEQKTKMLTKMFNKTDLSSVNALLATSSDRWNELGESITNSSGAMADMAETQLDNLQGDMTLLSSALDGLKQNVYEKIKPTLREVAQTVTNEVIPAVTSAITWAEEHQDVIAAVASVVGILATAYTAFSVVQAVKAAMDAAEVTTLGALIAMEWAQATAAAAAFAPYLLATVAIVALIAAIVLCVKHWDTIKVKITEVAGVVKDAVLDMWDKVKETLQNISEKFASIWNSIKETTSSVWNSIKETVSSVWNTITGIVEIAISVLVTIFQGAFSLLTLPWQAIWAWFGDDIKAAWTSIKTTVSTAINAVKTTITTVMNATKAQFSTVWNAIKGVVTTVWNGIKSVVSTATNAVKTTVTSVFNTTKSRVTSVWNAIKSAITGPIESAKSTVSSVIDNIKSKITATINSTKSTVSAVFSSIKSAMTEPIESAKNKISGIISTIKGFFSNLVLKIPKPSLPSLPHFKLQTGTKTILGKEITYPTGFGVEWYAKGAVFNTATILPSLSGWKGVGEAGAEVVSPISVLQDYVTEAVERATVIEIDYDLLGEKVAKACSKMNVAISLDNREVGRMVRRYV